MSTVRLNRDAFKRGVEDVMTFAPLREALRTAGGVFAIRAKEERKDDSHKKPSSELRQDDGKSSGR